MNSLMTAYDELCDEIANSGLTQDKLVTCDREAQFLLEYPNKGSFTSDYVDFAKDLAWGCFIQHPMFPRITKEERKIIYDTEKYEREMILNDLKFSTHINISKFNEPSTSRRFTATNDSCLSFVQVTQTPTHFRWVFVSRSTEVNRMLPSDLLTIGIIISEWTNWFWKYIYKYDTRPVAEKKVSLVFLMNNPHYYK